MSSNCSNTWWKFNSESYSDDVIIITFVYHVIVTTFTDLHSLAENTISNKGAKALSRALLVNRTLISLK